MQSIIEQELTMEKKKNGFKVHFLAPNGKSYCSVKNPKYTTHNLDKVTCKHCRYSSWYFCARIKRPR